MLARSRGGTGRQQPIARVLDLERRLRCRLCYAKDQAVVSIKWQSSTAGRGEPPA